MPRRPYVRRTAKKPDPIKEDVPLAVEQIAEKEAAPRGGLSRFGRPILLHDRKEVEWIPGLAMPEVPGRHTGSRGRRGGSESLP
ncbi:hypothetical protein [Mesorhizobium sp. M1B.F.Ca.ET.045.04.1.1]|uniref:hypothetical protein n=1 Tax=Mesorhizobium sp. M1B.F.Ca.ET.045.04.1.1 TaxID=2493673 RepID=UPI000F75C2E5|nr:hypothetical protein [Mesorhizobium sp. M1B.F.Ca.ET.045.04.1.1]AZO29427.1 hypothetical protein EJ071_19880 [Mesorhizobium sp. M1B.F.Ca.ET.045.04.1.1]